MKTAKDIQAKIDEGLDRLDAITALAKEEERELTDSEQLEINNFHGLGDEPGEFGKLDADLKQAEKIEARAKEIAARRMTPAIQNHMAMHGIAGFENKVPATAKRHGKLNAFTDEFEAYASGRFLQANLFGNEDAKTWCQENGIRAAMSATDNSAGGFVVNDGFEAAVIRQVEEYGVISREARNVPMTSDVTNIPRRESGLTVYYPGENTAITKSDMELGQVKLVATKRATLTQISNELSADAAISVADMLAQEIGWALAKKRDQDAFLGDGTSTYGGVTGLAGALQAGSTIDCASGNVSFATMILTEFEEMVGALPVYADSNAKWYIHKNGYAKSMLTLIDAAGGNTNMTLSDGVRSQPMFLGYPVVFTQAMPSADAVSTYQVYLGDLSQAVTVGNRTGLTIAADSSVYFASDAVGIRATERCAINVHERGDASNAGAVIGLKTAAS